jgi:simple sugar transport system ATP-binding protein
MAVVFISAELEEVVRVSDRVVVLRDRQKIGELSGPDTGVDDVLALIAAEAERVVHT